MASAFDIPPLDAVADWPAPEDQYHWYGDVSVEERVRRAISSGRMHHAWLLGGPKGVGKATFAFRMARYLLARGSMTDDDGLSLAVSPDHRVSHQIAASAHPNLLVLRRPWDDQGRRYKTELTVGEVRRLQTFFGSTPGEPGWRICIVDSADELNISAANALLKMLEEPPANGLFLLIAHRPGQLLPTIRSRCHRLDLKPLSDDAVRNALAGAPAGVQSDIDQAVALSAGSLRRAIEFVDGEGSGIYRRFAELTKTLPDVDYSRVHAFADTVAIRGRDDAFRGFETIIDDWLSRRVKGEPEPAGDLPPAVRGAPLACWADVWDKVRHTTLHAETLNLDRKQVVLQVFMALAAATRM